MRREVTIYSCDKCRAEIKTVSSRDRFFRDDCEVMLTDSNGYSYSFCYTCLLGVIDKIYSKAPGLVYDACKGVLNEDSKSRTE